VGGWAGILAAVSAVYVAVALIANRVSRRAILPLGAPLLRTGTAARPRINAVGAPPPADWDDDERPRRPRRGRGGAYAGAPTLDGDGRRAYESVIAAEVGCSLAELQRRMSLLDCR